MTRVLIAFDKFKDALTAREACEAAACGLRASHPDWQLDLCPLTDGGEGFCETLTHACGGRIEKINCSGPNGAQISAPVGYVDSSNLTAPVRARLQLETNVSLAIIEMSAASGLALLPSDQRDPRKTTSYGTGEQILSAAKAGADTILLGIGGSATNDLGLGALTALGLTAATIKDEPCRISTPDKWPQIAKIHGNVQLPPLFIACDVTNPLLGSQGATAVFGPQKGLPLNAVPEFEAEMARMAALLCAAGGKPLSLAAIPGTGAAGGIAFGFMVAANAQIVPGFDLVADWLNLPVRIAKADLVLTGEGRFDATSLSGKGPGALLAKAQQLGKPAHVFAGCVGLARDRHLHPITPAGMPLSEALPRTAELLEASVHASF